MQMIEKTNRSFATRVFWGFWAVVFGLTLWQGLAWFVEWHREVPFPTPGQTFAEFFRLLQGAPLLEFSLWHHLGVSLLRWVEGFGIGLSIGLLYAFLASWWRPFRLITMPTIEVLQLIPGLAWVPVAILVFGLNHTATVAMIAVTAFPTIAIAGVMGIQSVDKRFVRAGQMLGADSLTLFWTVKIPGALPHLLSGLRIGLGSAWRVLVAAEMIVGSGDGLGFAIIQSRWTMDYISAFVCILVIALAGLGLERLVIKPLERRTVQRWGMSHDN